jgi:hypothetical protein
VLKYIFAIVLALSARTCLAWEEPIGGGASWEHQEGVVELASSYLSESQKEKLKQTALAMLTGAGCFFFPLGQQNAAEYIVPLLVEPLARYILVQPGFKYLALSSLSSWFGHMVAVYTYAKLAAPWDRVQLGNYGFVARIVFTAHLVIFLQTYVW